MLLFVFLIIELFYIRTYLGQKKFFNFFCSGRGSNLYKKAIFATPNVFIFAPPLNAFCPAPLSICSGKGNPQGGGGGGKKNRICAKKFLDFDPSPP